MFFHEFKKTFRVFVRQKSLLFWALIFPLVLGVFFKLALGNIVNADEFEPIKVAVNEKLLDDQNFKNFTDNMIEEEILDIFPVDDDKDLDKEEIKAYIDKKDKVIVKKNGVFESILVSLLRYYNMRESMIKTILEKNPNLDFDTILEEKSYLNIKGPRKKLDPMMTFFFALIAYQLIYGYSWGLEIIHQYEANLSTVAKRNAISPVNKKVSLFASMWVGFILNFLISIVTMIIFNKILGVDFSENLAELLLITGLGALCGVSLGMLIGSSNKANIEIKSGIGLALSLLMSFLAGMMVSNVKVMIADNAPIINKLNPVALISDGIYSLYYYDSLDRFYNNIAWLLAVTLSFIVLTYIFTRGKQYDSI